MQHSEPSSRDDDLWLPPHHRKPWPEPPTQPDTAVRSHPSPPALGGASPIKSSQPVTHQPESDNATEACVFRVSLLGQGRAFGPPPRQRRAARAAGHVPAHAAYHQAAATTVQSHTSSSATDRGRLARATDRNTALRRRGGHRRGTALDMTRQRSTRKKPGRGAVAVVRGRTTPCVGWDCGPGWVKPWHLGGRG